ncbi:MAG TPA: AsmA family protein [Gammaproteobacteria bacterium]|nr:AsmA family protein [Gammaproteobacteria bacterium]
MITYFFKFLIALCLVGTLSLIGIITLVDPNQFKNVVQKRISEATGQMLTINGALSWHITPTLSLEAHDLSLETSSTYSGSAQRPTPMVTLKKIRFVPKLWSLLSGKPLVNIHLEGLNASVSGSIAGHSLLDNIQKMLLFQTTQKSLAFWVVPYDITVENATLQWKDAITNQDIWFKNITLSAQKVPLGIVGIHAPLNIHFELQDANSDHIGNFSFKATWAFNAKAQQLDIQDLECNTNFPTLPFNTLLGKFQIHRLQNVPIIAGSFHIPNLSVQYGLSNFNMPFYPVSAKTADLKGSFTYQMPMLAITSFNLTFENEANVSGSFKTDLHAKTLKTLNLTGSFVGKNLRIGTLPIPEIKTTLQANNGIFIFDHIKAQLASSHHQAKMQIDIRGDVPQFTIADQMDSFEINELLARLDLKDKLYGNIKATVHLTTQGNSPDAWLQHLSGNAYVHLTDGRVRGIDLSPLLRHAQSTLVMLKDTLSKRNSANISAILTAELGEWRLQAMNVDLLVTPFRHLETNITFDNGRAYTADFKLTHPEYTVNGHGMVDLMQKNVEYQALALLTHPKQHPSEPFSLFLKETPLAIHIKGPFDNLVVQPNLAHYADGAINVVHKGTTEKAADNTLEKLFGFP